MQAARPTTKPSTQRRMLFQAPAHRRHKFFGAPLSPELQTSHGAKTMPVRSGDTVRVMRGDHKDFEGKITRVDMKEYRVYVEGLTREKVDGSTVFVPVHPSKVMLINLSLDDKWRRNILQRRKGAKKKAEEGEEKPRRKRAEVVEAKEEVARKEEAVPEEQPAEKKPRKRRRKAPAKPVAEEAEEKAEPEEKPRTKRTRAKRKTASKKEGEE